MVRNVLSQSSNPKYAFTLHGFLTALTLTSGLVLKVSSMKVFKVSIHLVSMQLFAYYAKVKGNCLIIQYIKILIKIIKI